VIWGAVMEWGAFFAIVSAVSLGFTLLAMFMQPQEPRPVLLRCDERDLARHVAPGLIPVDQREDHPYQAAANAHRARSTQT
jgi:hypothetical protein